MTTGNKTRLLCTFMAICMVVTGTPYSYENENINQVFASESTASEPDLMEESSDTEEESETQQIPETETNETQTESEVSSEPETESETALETQTADESCSEENTTACEESELAETEFGAGEQMLYENLEKLNDEYPNMRINADGYYEYTDSDGTVYTYDPYDPEFAKYMLNQEMLSQETVSYDTGTVTANAGTTVSPFTGAAYTHEAHVSEKIVRNGIDVSKYQKEINWSSARAAGVEFAFIRVGYRGYGAAGSIAGDEYAVQNIKNAYSAGVKVGVYFFSQAITEAEAAEEALYCYNFLKNNGLSGYITMPVIIDYEYSPNSSSGRLANAHLSKAQHQAICDKFVTYMKSYGYQSGIYANFSMLTNDMQPTASSIYESTDYWIARYNNATHYPNRYRFWQYSSKGTVAGISGYVDCNFWYDEKKNINDPTCHINIEDETDFIDEADDIGKLISIYDSARKYELKEGKDYNIKVVSETKNERVVYHIGIVGIGSYEGSITKTITTSQLTLSADMIGAIPAQEYTGLEITTQSGLPVVINNGNATLVEDKDYKLSYLDNINVGTGTVIVTGIGNYTGEIRQTFTISQAKLTADMFEQIPDVVYIGAEVKTDNGVIIRTKNINTNALLTEGTDYTVKYASNKNTGTAKAIVTGKGNYTGNQTLTFQIVKRDLSEDAVVSIGKTTDTYAAAYTGKAINPGVVVSLNGRTLPKSDYTVEYSNNVNPTQEACVTIKGKGNCYGSVSKYFTITQKPLKPVKLTNKMVSLASTCVQITGGSIKPQVCAIDSGKQLTEDIDYTVTCRDQNNRELSSISSEGQYQIVVTGIGAYTGSVTNKLTVVSSDSRLIDQEHTNVTFVSENTAFTYTGKAIRPEIKLTEKSSGVVLKSGTDYTVTYADNINVGTARITIKGKGSYQGSMTVTFGILPIELGQLRQEKPGEAIVNDTVSIALNQYSYDYNGKQQKPKLTIKYAKKLLKENTDYQVSVKAKNTAGNEKTLKNADTYEVSITFKGNYTGNALLSYEIRPIDISRLSVSVPKQKYTGKSICPELPNLTIKLKAVKLDASALEGVVADGWYNNTDVSQGKNKGGFTLISTTDNCNFVKNTTKNVTFQIVKKSITDQDVAVTLGGYDVTGGKCALELVYEEGKEYDQQNGAAVVVRDSHTNAVLVENVDYTVRFSNNKKIGTAKVKITGAGGYSGSKTISFRIKGKPLDETVRVVMEQDCFIYSGKAVAPGVQVYFGNTLLKKNKDYTVKYANNVNAGIGEILITGKGIYADTISRTFTILPKQASNAKKITIADISEQRYTGNVVVPKVKVAVDGKTLVKGKDYTVSILNSTRLTYTENGKQKGTATAVITGIGNYKGTLGRKNFTVVK